MSALPDREHYNIGDPRSFGKPVDPQGLEGSMSSFASHYSTPSAEMRLFHGQDPMMQQFSQLMRRDRLLSAFPDVQEGIQFLEKVLPAFVKELTVGNQLPPSDSQSKLIIPELEADKEKFVSQLLFDFFVGKEEIEEGGQETGYISFNKPPKEQSCEYIGEKLTRLIRARVHEDRDPKTRAFFGWIGRHLMKKIYPKTDFSLDRHNEMVNKEKKEMTEAFKKFRERLEKGIEGDLSLEKAYRFFGELGDLISPFTSLDCAETPLAVRISQDLRINFNGFNDIEEFLPTREGEYSYSSYTFSKFIKNWQEKPSEGFNYREYYRGQSPKVFEDIPQDDDVIRTIPKEQLLPKWFEMLRTILLEETDYVPRVVQDFNVTYFRFIGNKSVATGYAYAQEHRDEILANLPQVLQLTEEEIQMHFMQGDPKILHDEYDSGENSSDDMYKDVNFEEIGEPLTEFVKEMALPSIVLTEEEKAKTDEDWFDLIANGPNAQLYKDLKTCPAFSDEEWFLGMHPLFFGNWLGDKEVSLAYEDKLKAFFEQRRNLTPIEAEKERIEEFKAGVFSPPKNYEDLIINANRQLIRLQGEFDKYREQATTFNIDAITQASILQERMIAIQRVKNTIRKIITKQK